MAHSPVENRLHQDLSIGQYALIYAVLLVLTVATYLFSRVNLGIWSMVIAMVIAVVKASLVAFFFMQLWQHGGTYRLVVATALLWLALMIVFILADVKTRFPLAVPSNAPFADIPVHGDGGRGTSAPTQQQPTP